MSTQKTRIRVWDAPVRVFHWLMVLSFTGAYLTAESERWRMVHVSLGYALGGLVVFRLVWGVVGTRYARFSSFVRGPVVVLRYLRGMLGGQPVRYVGHNPAGAVAIVLMLACSGVIVGSGWAVYNDLGGHLAEALHEGVGNFMLAVVGVHIAGVVMASRLHQENLVRAMVTGTKPGMPGEGIDRAWWGVAALLLAAVMGFGWLQWRSAPPTPVPSAGAAQYGERSHENGD